MLGQVAHDVYDGSSIGPPLLSHIVYDVHDDDSIDSPLLGHGVYEVCEDSSDVLPPARYNSPGSVS